jgi:hypothetical protein
VPDIPELRFLIQSLNNLIQVLKALNQTGKFPGAPGLPRGRNFLKRNNGFTVAFESSSET